MIWLDGELNVGDQWNLRREDRIFEHGLGLFETLRTWNGLAPLLDRHLARLQRSARVLGIPLAGVNLPTQADVSDLVQSTGPTDALLRLTVSAGRSSAVRPTAWMTINPLPSPAAPSGYRVVDAAWTVAIHDPLAQHKTLNYWAKRIAFDQAHEAGADEAIFWSADGRAWEGSRTNVFLIVGQHLITPFRTGPIIPGIMRELVLKSAQLADLHATEADVTSAQIDTAEEIFLTNSVRGLIPVDHWRNREYRPADSTFPRTSRLRDLVMVDLSTGRTQR